MKAEKDAGTRSVYTSEQFGVFPLQEIERPGHPPSDESCAAHLQFCILAHAFADTLTTTETWFREAVIARSMPKIRC